jgi:biopolymer transport protein ExbB
MAANKKLKKSSIYRLYAIGVQEVKQRFDQQVASGKKFQLSEVSLNSVRAALDAAMMRETQKLNSGIVLLTIAIAGGPFLGLLGTVVGVMITFAAIAAAGDVNVNAIAPGIAAALVATVAGLAVAIPALFGYNWLASQIKNASNDGAVFLDEFITKSAEMHSA